jgi:hypothetical protein
MWPLCSNQPKKGDDTKKTPFFGNKGEFNPKL